MKISEVKIEVEAIKQVKLSTWELQRSKYFANYFICEISTQILTSSSDAEFAFGIYDCDGSGKIDAYDIPDVLRSLNLNPTMELCEKMGATKKRGEKKLTVEEFLPIFGQVRRATLTQFAWNRQNNDDVILHYLGQSPKRLR